MEARARTAAKEPAMNETNLETEAIIYTLLG